MIETNLMTCKDLREQMSTRVDVLDKIKKLFLLPQLDMMTVQQIADYYKVGTKAIQSCYERNKDEIIRDGVKKYSPSMMKNLNLQLEDSENPSYIKVFRLSDDVTLRVPNAGINLFSKRAVLRIGMLLRDSEIAKEVRTQLLNAFEKTTDEQKVKDIETEEGIIARMSMAFAAGDITTYCAESMKLNLFQKRHISRLSEKIEADKPKVAFAETTGSCKDTVSVGTYSKMLFDLHGIKLGRNQLFEWMRNKLILDKDNIPYQKFMNYGWFKVVNKPKAEIKRNIPVTRITAKGQQKLFELIAKDFGLLDKEEE